ncbi:Type 1 glutamine amidotransferase-like domain-containing protein [Candidatus Woesearchaeota archaeon]|nr:Type 1 glutamine amidotransferase-like domain-containing protein [Candidatus Woesearchaeota archaeon]
MPELILSGGKGINKERDIHKLFLKRVNKKPILYIPLAKESKYFSECYDWITSALPNQNIKMLANFKEQKINLKDFKAVYIGGGNVFKLLKEFRENNFDKKLINFNGIIYGGSAGAIIWGMDISNALFGKIKDKNKIKLKDLNGFNKLNNYSLRAHYTEKEKLAVKNYVKKTKIPIIALPEDSGIYLKNKKIKEINKVYYFDDV